MIEQVRSLEGLDVRLTGQQMQKIYEGEHPTVAVLAAPEERGMLAGAVVELAEAAARVGHPREFPRGLKVLAVDGSRVRPAWLEGLEGALAYREGGLDRYVADLRRVLAFHRRDGTTLPHEWWLADDDREPTEAELDDEAAVWADLPIISEYAAPLGETGAVDVLAPVLGVPAGEIAALGWPDSAPIEELAYLRLSAARYYDVVVVSADVDRQASERGAAALRFWANSADALFVATDGKVSGFGPGTDPVAILGSPNGPHRFSASAVPERIEGGATAAARSLYAQALAERGWRRTAAPPAANEDDAGRKEP